MYCENCSSEIPSKKIDHNSEYPDVDENYLCKCGFHPIEETDFLNHYSIDNPRYSIKYCNGCRMSLNDNEYQTTHIDDVDENTGRVFTYCNISNMRVTLY